MSRALDRSALEAVTRSGSRLSMDQSDDKFKVT